MNDAETLLKQGIAAVQAGELERGNRLLQQVLAEDPRNEQAWLWLSVAVDDVEQRKACLRRVLEINYYNEEAWRSLRALTLSPPAPKPGEEELPVRTEGSEFPCPGCDSDMYYSPTHQALTCSHCGRVVDIPADSAPPQSFPLAGLPATREAGEEWVGRQIYRCQDCGANTTLSTRQGSLACPFCGSSYVVKPPSGVPLIPPQAVIPFKLEEEEAEEALRRWLGSSWLRPGDLARRAAIERLHGVYIPFWVFDGLSTCQWRDEDGWTRQSTRWYRDVPFCGSLSLTAEMARGIEPFEFGNLLPYRAEYLAGWPVEVYQIALTDASLQVRRRIVQEAEKSFDGVEQVHFADVRWRLTLLPAYLGVYRYEGALYLFAVNGQTGRACGKAPRSVARVALVAVAGLVFAAVLILALIRLWPHLTLLLQEFVSS